MSEIAEIVETEEQDFELEELTESERLALEIEDASAARRSIVASCERLLMLPGMVDEANLSDAQRAAVQFFRDSQHLSARLAAIDRIDDVADRALTMTIAEFKFCLGGALDLFQKTYEPEAECIRQIAIAFEDEVPELAEGLAATWRSYGASEMRETMKRAVYSKAGL